MGPRTRVRRKGVSGEMSDVELERAWLFGVGCGQSWRYVELRTIARFKEVEH